MAIFAVIILGTICIRTLILATIECGCIQLCVLEFVNFLLRGCRCSSICVAKHEFEKVQRFVLVFGQIQVQSSNFSWMGSTKFEVKFWHFWWLIKLEFECVWSLTCYVWTVVKFFFALCWDKQTMTKIQRKLRKASSFNAVL